MLVACRLAGLSALEAYYAGVGVDAQCAADALRRRSRDYLRRKPPSLAFGSSCPADPEFAVWVSA